MLRSLTTLILLSLQAGAADDHPYTCEVTHVYELSNDGILRPSNWENQNAREHLHGVARTGEIVGKVLPTGHMHLGL